MIDPTLTTSSIIDTTTSQQRKDKLAVASMPAKAKDSSSGYPGLAEFLHSDDSFMIYRRVGLLHLRDLLHQEEELVHTAQALQRQDESHYLQLFQGKGARESKAPTSYPHESQDRLLRAIDEELAEYSKGSPLNNGNNILRRFIRFDDLKDQVLSAVSAAKHPLPKRQRISNTWSTYLHEPLRDPRQSLG